MNLRLPLPIFHTVCLIEFVIVCRGCFLVISTMCAHNIMSTLHLKAEEGPPMPGACLAMVGWLG